MKWTSLKTIEHIPTQIVQPFDVERDNKVIHYPVRVLYKPAEEWEDLKDVYKHRITQKYKPASYVEGDPNPLTEVCIFNLEENKYYLYVLYKRFKYGKYICEKNYPPGVKPEITWGLAYKKGGLKSKL